MNLKTMWTSASPNEHNWFYAYNDTTTFRNRKSCFEWNDEIC